jgi:hypothetical protein
MNFGHDSIVLNIEQLRSFPTPWSEELAYLVSIERRDEQHANPLLYRLIELWKADLGGQIHLASNESIEDRYGSELMISSFRHFVIEHGPRVAAAEGLPFSLFSGGEVPLDACLNHLFNLSALQWAVYIHFKPKRFKFRFPHNKKEMWKPIGELYASVMDLCEKLHSFVPSGVYDNAAQWFRLVIEEGEIQGNRIGIDLEPKERLARLQKQNKRLSESEDPFNLPHTCLLIDLAIGERDRPNGSERIGKAARRFILARKKWATAQRSSDWRALIYVDGRLALSTPGRQAPKILPKAQSLSYSDFCDSEPLA